MEKTEKELLDIADKMLAQLENDYWQTQQCNLLPQIECPEEEVNHEDYHVLDGDDEPDHMSDSEESAEEEGDNCQEVQQEVKTQIVVTVDQKIEQIKVNEDLGEMVEVFPTQECVVPQKQININSEKIKQMTLSMNLPVPQWMKDEDLLKNRITELFGKKVK